MKLRYRLFLWVGLLFAVTFIVSFIIEEIVTRKSLNQTQQEMVDTLYKVNEQKRRYIESYMADMLWKMQAKVDAVLQGVANYQLVEKGFIPSKINLQQGTWLDAASLMITNQWLGFVQNFSDETLMCEIVVPTNELSDTYHFPITENLHLVAVRDENKPHLWKGPFIGVGFELKTFHSSSREEDEGYFVLFSKEALLNLNVDDALLKNSLGLSVNFLEPFLKWVDVPKEPFLLESFLNALKDAKIFLEEHAEVIPNEKAWNDLIRERDQKDPNRDPVDFPCFDYLHEKTKKANYNDDEVLRYLKSYIEHYNKVGLIWGISALTDSALFGEEPLGKHAPLGMGVVNAQTLCGKALESKKVFRREVGYDVEKALKGMNLPPDFLTTHLDIIAPKGDNHVYFGNTLKLEDPKTKKTGYLTLGAHGGPVLSALARATHQMSLFVSDNHVIAISDPNGREVAKSSAWFNMPVEKLLTQNSGVISFEGKEYFFLHIAPYKKLDLHFFIFNLKDKEFQFIDSVKDDTKALIAKLSLQMRVGSLFALAIVLLLLNNIAKKVTRPISHLVEVTQTVAEGKLQEVDIPEIKQTKRSDEVQTLYHNFFEMIKGLREKEKVRGVLNKVVSKEIAEEALKGRIQLGGEEKRATVFFADIRGFTALTENMDPKQVIQLINTCMTKMSKIIDQYGGVIDKYVGDAVMALFGAPLEKNDSALHGVKCAVDIINCFKEWNEILKKENQTPIEIGIGIHTGSLVAGNMGAEDRLNYTVLGANVNLAARLCGKAEPMQALISHETLEEKGVKETVVCDPLDPLELKGFSKPISVYSVQSYKF